MRTEIKDITLSISFKQIVDMVRKLPYEGKVKLGEVISEETSKIAGNDKVLTHFASENALAKDWLSPTEDEAWANL